MTMFKSTGKLIYDPIRYGYKKNKNWRCILTVDNDLTRYYRWVIKKEFGFILYEPSWKSHITIINGEKPLYEKLWKKHNNRKIDFVYDINIRWSGDTTDHKYIFKYWFLDVYCAEFNSLRQELGLSEKSKYHITIGTLYNK